MNRDQTADETRWTLYVAGLQGSGKTTVARRLSEASGAAFVDADDYHLRVAREAMSQGEACDKLGTDYRDLWLERVQGACFSESLRGNDVVCSCSLLTQALRARVVGCSPLAETKGEQSVASSVLWLSVQAEELEQRLCLRDKRGGHFARSGLLASQLETAELPHRDEPGVTSIDGAGEEQAVLGRAFQALAAWLEQLARDPREAAASPPL